MIRAKVIADSIVPKIGERLYWVTKNHRLYVGDVLGYWIRPTNVETIVTVLLPNNPVPFCVPARELVVRYRPIAK